MYKLTLTDGSYNKLEFVFCDFIKMTSFMEVALDAGGETMTATVTNMEFAEEGEADDNH